jgi:hypothetical protein
MVNATSPTMRTTSLRLKMAPAALGWAAATLGWAAATTMAATGANPLNSKTVYSESPGCCSPEKAPAL